MSNKSLFTRFAKEQHRLLLATLPTCGVVEYDLPEVNQQQLLNRMALEALVRKGGH